MGCRILTCKGSPKLTLSWCYLMEILPRISDAGCMSSAVGFSGTGMQAAGWEIPFQ